jgi:hypothetical protein
MSQANTPTQNRHNYEDESEDEDLDDDNELPPLNLGYEDDLKTDDLSRAVRGLLRTRVATLS